MQPLYLLNTTSHLVDTTGVVGMHHYFRWGHVVQNYLFLNPQNHIIASYFPAIVLQAKVVIEGNQRHLACLEQGNNFCRGIAADETFGSGTNIVKINFHSVTVILK